MLPLVMGYGLAFCMMAQIFDLSVGSKVILSAAVGGILCTKFGLGLPGLIIGSVASGVLFGAFMGYIHNLLRIPSLVLSLGTVMLVEVLSNVVVGKQAFLQISSSASILGKAPNNIILSAALGVVCLLIYYNTKFSYHVSMVGSNEILAKNMGISPKKINFLCYTLAGFFYGFAAVLQISYSGAVSTALGMKSLNMVFQPVIGVLIGIEMMSIIDNLLFNIFIGELCISIIFNGLIAMGISSTMQDVTLGVFIILVMAVSGNKERIRDMIRRHKVRREAGKAKALSA